ncbi:hypothetical protein EXIGLDRAFT_736570 [Exidia glandulosa HHB12029]|uniref:Uncharacterized protein n=1 Tax=Exidia glandulosa HHB12029 TaxID=1314781 RepID=A0A166N5X7_EXIGL|nr:hypothetical protein EXIGLDRAFT_736570 [Exidia glandulosa HHB12029]
MHSAHLDAFGLRDSAGFTPSHPTSRGTSSERAQTSYVDSRPRQRIPREI